MHDENLQPETINTEAACACPETVSDMNDIETVEQQAQTAPEIKASPVLDISTLTAARDAAAFVARIFAETASDAPDAPDAPLPGAADGAPAPAPADTARPVPARWPQDAPMQGQRVLILGLGASGMAMARWCARCGAQVVVADTRAEPPALAALRAELPQARFATGALDAGLLDDGPWHAHAVYRSPGLSPAQIAPIAKAASARQIPVGGELDLFAQALRALRERHGYGPAVLAVTGTNGKTTVTALTRLLAECAGKSAVMAGNIGPTLLDTLAARIDARALPEVWVLELSSFQLEGAQGFEPSAAAVLNLTQGHLDWHGDMQAYARAKARIFGANALMALNRDDPLVMEMLPAPVRVKLHKPRERAHVTFGADMPRRPGDFGIETAHGMAWLVRAHEADETARRSRQHEEEELYVQRLMPLDALRIRGRHNAVNALAALALAQAAGCALAPMLRGLREYRGEPHRVQSVGTVRGVEYFDDSKGTNVGATVAALAGLGSERRIVVILGGLGKGQDFTPLAAPLARCARAAVLIGRDGPLIRQALAGCGAPLIDAAGMDEAVRQAAAAAHAGDAVLLSPACASMDMFKDYADRARAFTGAVRALAREAGEPLDGGPA